MFFMIKMTGEKTSQEFRLEKLGKTRNYFLEN